MSVITATTVTIITIPELMPNDMNGGFPLKVHLTMVDLGHQQPVGGLVKP